MSRAKTIEGEFSTAHTAIAGDVPGYYLTVKSCIARAYDAGYLEGSGQSSITALERDVVVAALEWADNDGPIESYSKLREASRALKDALEREATE
jgi:hypothetical protein